MAEPRTPEELCHHAAHVLRYKAARLLEEARKFEELGDMLTPHDSGASFESVLAGLYAERPRYWGSVLETMQAVAKQLSRGRR
jgi:hypothetical protein